MEKIQMRILLLGKDGQVGWELQRTLSPLDDLLAVGRSEIDLLDIKNSRNYIRSIKPQIIINAAAYTDVEKAESEQEIAMAVNGVAPGMLAEEAKALDAVLIHYSTDYVFDGQKRSPYTEDDPPNPINIYGKSKLMGEQAIQQVDNTYLILRTSWVYSLRKKSFVTNVLDWAQKNRTLRIVTDQVSNPTWCRMLAETTARIIEASNHSINRFKEWQGLYHLAGVGYASRFEFAKAILAAIPANFPNVVENILPASTQDFHDQARRPAFSALNLDKFAHTFSLDIPEWEKSLKLALADSLLHE
jgi:dTDP-4-dehydrorhamnose reductase